MLRFIDRREEQEVLKQDWDTKKNAFLVVYGRRRIGKTRLIGEFLKNKQGIKYTAEDTNKRIQINEFKTIIASYLKDEFLAEQEILEWTNLFAYLAKVLGKEKRIYIWIDEFSYVIKNDSSAASALQKFIDSFLRKSNIFFIVSGSLFGLMSEKVLSAASPLYGRRTRDILLKAIGSQHIHQFLDMSAEDATKTALTIGGIPEYLIAASKYKSHREFVNSEFLKKDGYFYREPYFLLSQEFKEIKTYLSILNAIAYGNTRPTKIANFVGLNAREIYPYLDLLISYGFVKRETSLLGSKRKGIYSIEDTFFDFWFNFVYKNRESIETGLYKINAGELNEFLGKKFETFVRKNFRRFFKQPFTKTGRWWHKEKEIDIVAINEKSKQIIFAECKWKNKADCKKILIQLGEKTNSVNWKNEKRKEEYAIFAKSFKKKIKKWEGKKVHCFDLKDITETLKD